MATRSTLIRKVGDYYESIYCHWDGHPETKLPVLNGGNYSTPAQVDALFKLGDLSSLGNTLDETKAHHRDMGEPMPGWKDLKNTIHELATEEYAYFYDEEKNAWTLVRT